MGLVSVASDKTAFDKPYDPITTSGMLRFAKSIDDLFNDVLNGEEAFNRQTFTTATELTIASGVLSAPSLALHTIASESGFSDNLDTIGASNNSFLVIKAKASHTITVRHGFGNIWSASGSNALISGNRALLLWCQGSQWAMIGIKSPLANKTATRDPGSSDGFSSGYAVGSIWVNTTLDRVWMCVNSTDNAAVWKWISAVKNSYTLRAAAATVEGIGMNSAGLSLAGTVASANDSSDTWVSFTPAAALAGQQAGPAENIVTANGIRPSSTPIFEMTIKTGSDVTSQRIWVGLLNGSGSVDLDTLAPSYYGIAFRYSTVAGDSGWRPVLSDGTTQNTGTAIGTVAADTVYKLRVRIVGTGTPTAYFSVNDGAEQSLTSNFPSLSNGLVILSRLIQQAASARQYYFTKAEVKW